MGKKIEQKRLKYQPDINLGSAETEKTLWGAAQSMLVWSPVIVFEGDYLRNRRVSEITFLCERAYYI